MAQAKEMLSRLKRYQEGGSVSKESWEKYIDDDMPKESFADLAQTQEYLPLNVRKLVDAGVIRITQPGDGRGGYEVTPEPWSYSLVTAYNDQFPNSVTKNWPSKPESLEDAATSLNKPGALYDGKYRQILWSAKQAGLSPEDVFLNKPKKYQEGGEVTDEFPEEAGVMPDQNPSEAAKRLLFYKKTAAPTPPTDIARLGKQAGLIGLGFAPGAGVADYFGKFPAVEGGTEPSAVENFQKGNYGTAALQGLGAMGDLAMAVPVAGTAIGSVMKAPRAAQKMLQELKGSRVVDQSGEPLTVYHGTNTKNIKEFDTAKKGAWFSEDPYIAEAYTRREGADAGTIVSAKINVKNPLVVPQDIDMSKRYSVEEIINRINDDNATTYVPKDFGLKPNTEVPAFDVVSSPRFIKELKKGGFDGIKAYEGGYSTWNVFDNKQITRDSAKDISKPVLPSSTTAKEDLAKVEAPSIMTRSGLTELSDYIKNREGGYGLRRVERAADEIPNLERLYALDALRSAFSGDNARGLMTMKPADFEKYAAPLLTNLSQQSKDNIANLKTIQGAGGFSDVPFFLVNKELAGSTGVPFVTGHEGRHRSRAMDAAGVESGLVQFLPRAELREPFPRKSQEQYIDAIRREMALSGNKIKPEKYYLNETDEKSFQRPAIDLPDIYAKGGEVRKPI